MAEHTPHDPSGIGPGGEEWPRIPDDDPYLMRGQEHYLQTLREQHPEIPSADLESMARVHLSYDWFRHTLCLFERVDEKHASSGATTPPWYER